MQQQQPQTNQQQSPAQPQNTQQQQAQAQPQNGNRKTIAPQDLSLTEVRQMQAVLDKAGLNAGRPNGKWEPKTPKLNRSFAKASHMRPPRAAQQLRTGLGSLRTFRELGSEELSANYDF
jgi:hypothetical protein